MIKINDKDIIFYEQKYYNCLSRLKNYTKLSNEEVEKINIFWSKYFKNIPLNFFILSKNLNYFNEQYIPEFIYKVILNNLYRNCDVRIQDNKYLTNIYYRNFNRPKCIIGKIDNNYYDINNQKITEETAFNIIKKYNTQLIYKPIIGCKGRNIQLLNNINIIRESNNFIVQERVNQSKEMNQLNSTSLNTMRITTLYINSKCTIINSYCKIGKNGSIIDNSASGARCIKILEDGTLNNFYIQPHENFKKGDSINNIKLSSFKIPNYSEVKKFCINLHEYSPYTRLIGWDIALDNNNKPILIEGNSIFPGCFTSQIVDGPFFRERLEEVLDNYLK